MSTSARLITLLLLFTPAVAFADGLTAVFGFQILHLLIGNLLIGIIETIYLRARFSLSANMFLIILGNYLSMFFGFIVAADLTKILGFSERFFGFADNLKEYRTALILGIFISFLVTLIVELPFYKWALKTKSWKTAFKKEIEPNILTNILVLLAYFFIPPGK
jgi:hypothetical protein